MAAGGVDGASSATVTSARSESKDGSMTAEGHNVDANLLGIGRDHGHYFAKKTFGKPTYCHHCCDKIWGMLTQGYACEVCNFVCHEKCLKTVVSYCSGVALQLIKNPVAHTWSQPGLIKRKFCCVCRKRTDEALSLECEVCEYYVHVDCSDLAVSDCKEAATYVPNLDLTTHEQFHHMREGNLPKDSKCVVCKKSCWSAECLAGMRCEWCGQTAHAVCYRQMSKECDFGVLRKIMLPPSSLTIPRTELPMEQLLAITANDPPQSRKVSSPSKIQADDVSSSGEELKEREDSEILRVFDGNSSLRAQVCRTASVPKTATVQQIRDTALRRFHITDNPDNYYVTQVVSDAGEEETLEDPVPLRNVKRPEGRRAQIFLRYKDDPDKDVVKLYGGWLRVPVTFCTLTVNKDTLVQDALADALENFGLDPTTWNSITGSWCCRANMQFPREHAATCSESSQGSLRATSVVRLCTRKRRSHDHACIRSEPPVSLAQRHMIQKPFTAIGPIYFEYGSLVITFNTPKAATAAVQRLQNAIYEDKKLIVLCLPNVQPHMLPPDSEPLLVLVNVKSGGCQGTELIQSFRKLLNPFQVFDVLKGGPLVGLYVFRNIPKYKILACGGDGTIGWVLQCLDIAKQDAACFSPPCGIVPLGTGNDLARVLRWGGGYTGEENPLDILKDVIEADEVRLDRWAVVFHEEERSQPPNQDAACFSPPCGIVPLGTGNDLARVLRWGGGYTGEENPLDILKDVIEADEVRLDRWAVVFHEEERSQPPNQASAANPAETDQTMSNPEDQTSMIIMNNYFGIGIDADVCLKFHNKRDANPEKFQSRLFNKTQYAKIGLRKMFFERSCKDLWKRIEVEVDGKPVELPNIEGIVVLNLLSWGSGANPWGTAKEESPFQKPTHYDGLLEVVGISDVSRLGLIQSKLAAGTRIAQGGSIRITTHEEWPVQVDGEPHIQPPGTITILKSALKAQMLKKAKKSRRGATSSQVRAVASEGSPCGPLGVPSSLDAAHGKSTPEALGDSDEEGDAFL
ncbi:diacylglycerol kinase accessory domain protein [Ostertagia ostertagi]